MIDYKRKAHNKLDLSGQRFGRLIVESEVEGWNKHQKSLWQCKCDCGNTCQVTGSKLTSKWTQSCGCLQKERTGSAAIARANAKPFGEAAAHAAFLIKRGNAKRRNLEFSLTEQQFRNLSAQPCFYCSKQPSNVYNNNNGGGGFYRGDFVYSGIDRLDNSLGYVEGNCVPCCKECNFMKADISIDMVYKLYHKLDDLGKFNK